GEVEDIESMKKIKKGLDSFKRDFPNLAAHAAKTVWDAQKPELVADDPNDLGLGLPEELELPPSLVVSPPDESPPPPEQPKARSVSVSARGEGERSCDNVMARPRD
ncbi:MAG: hypothetical protein KC420_22055, partial [Myxococcales bacterium]|nr:hypothetical protein [Myxococcales bacterium]